MIQQLADSYLRIQPGNTTPAPVSIDQRLAPQAAGDNGDENIDRLYEELKAMWKDDPDMSSSDIIDYLRKFEAVDGSTPYKPIQSHTSALTQIMSKVKEEGGEDLPIYATLNQAVGFAVVSNGILNSFMGKMLSLPETPEEW